VTILQAEECNLLYLHYSSFSGAFGRLGKKRIIRKNNYAGITNTQNKHPWSGKTPGNQMWPLLQLLKENIPAQHWCPPLVTLFRHDGMAAALGRVAWKSR